MPAWAIAREFSTPDTHGGICPPPLRVTVIKQQLAYVPYVTPGRFGARNNGFQVFSPTAAALFIATGAGLFYYFNSEKESLKKKKGCVVNIGLVRKLLTARNRGRTRDQGLR